MQPELSNFTCAPDPDNPGWLDWHISDPECFNAKVLGKLLVRQETPQTCRNRLVPMPNLHNNSAGKVHGGITLAFADVSLFSTLYLLAEVDAGRSVTLDLQCQFITAGDLARPLDCVVELLRETRRLAFLRGLVVQDDDLVASFTATVRKPSSR